MLAEINAAPPAAGSIWNTKHGQVWEHSLAPGRNSTCSVSWPQSLWPDAKADGVKGSLMFQGSPRFYFGFDPHH